VTGACLMTKKEVMKEINGLDENFFFYLEDVDCQKRAAELGYLSMVMPSAKAVHQWGGSVNNQKILSKKMNLIYKKSRHYFFKKHYCFLKRIIFLLFDKVKNFTWIFLIKKQKIGSYQMPSFYFKI
jgi:GT2 family glycosyltransferase